MSNDGAEAFTELFRILEPHDAGLKRYDAEVAKSQRKAEILEKIVEAAIEIPEPVVCDEIRGCECGLCDPAGPVVYVQREFVHAAECPWGCIQDLTKELEELEVE
jgi:hypothetical protein